MMESEQAKALALKVLDLVLTWERAGEHRRITFSSHRDSVTFTIQEVVGNRVYDGTCMFTWEMLTFGLPEVPGSIVAEWLKDFDENRRKVAAAHTPA